MCHCTSHTLQPGICSLFSCHGDGAEPATPICGPRPSSHGNQVTPGPAGNQLGGHGAVKQGERERKRDRGRPVRKTIALFFVPPSLRFTASPIGPPASTPPCSRESRGLYRHPTDSSHHCHTAHPPGCQRKTRPATATAHPRSHTGDVHTVGFDHYLIKGCPLLHVWAAVGGSRWSCWCHTSSTFPFNLIFPASIYLVFFRLRFDCWQTDCFTFINCC